MTQTFFQKNMQKKMTMTKKNKSFLTPNDLDNNYK